MKLLLTAKDEWTARYLITIANSFIHAGIGTKLSSYVKSINKYSLTNLNQYLKKQVGDEVDFLHVNRH